MGNLSFLHIFLYLGFITNIQSRNDTSQGKYNIEKLGLKERVVALLENDDPKVFESFMNRQYY